MMQGDIVRSPTPVGSASGYAYYGDEEEGLNIGELFRKLSWLFSALWRGRWVFLATLLACVALGVALTLLITPKYFATASVQIDQETERVLGTEQQLPGAAYQDADRFLETNVEVLKSRATAIRVAQALGFFNDNKFIDDMGAKLRFGSASADTALERREAVLKLLDKNVDIQLPVNSRMVSISFKSPSPDLSAQVANAYADSFITGNLQRKFNSTSYARAFLEKQLAPARERLEVSERQLVVYAREKGLIDTAGGAGGDGDKPNKANSVTISSLLALNDASAVATANRIAAEERWRVAKGRPSSALPESYSNKAIQDLFELRAEKQAALRNEQQRHTDDYPTVLQLKAEITELDKHLGSFGSGIRQSIGDQYIAAKEQEQALTAAVEGLKRDTLREQDDSIQYNVLRRDVDTNRSMYEALLQRYKEVSAASGIASNNIAIVDRAERSLEPGSPKLMLNLALSILAGIVLGTVIVLLRELFDDRVQNAADAERKFSMPALGVIPAVASGTDIVPEFIKPRSAVSEAYQTAATGILLSSHTPPKVIVLTSTNPGEGKSISCIGLAAAFQRLNKRTILVECDLRRPTLVAKLFHAESDESRPGLSDFLARQTQTPGIETSTELNFDFVAAGHPSPTPVDLLGSPEFGMLLQQLSDKYDIVILDAPPVLGLADAAILASRSDAVLFVIEAGKGHRGRARATLERMRRFGTPVLGAILTKVPVSTRFGTGYDYEYYTYSS